MAKTTSDADSFVVTAAALRTFAEAIRKIAEKHDEVATWMDSDGIPELEAKNLKTSAPALVHLSKFLGNVVAAYCEHNAAKGVETIDGGYAVLFRYLNRTSAGLLADAAKPAPAAGEPTVSEAAIRKGVKEFRAANRKPAKRK